MSIEKRIKYLMEKVEDIPAEGKNIHYTNIEALIGILKLGYIKGSEYDIKTEKAKSNKKSLELATIRSSSEKKVDKMISNENGYALSSGVDNVKITLYTDRILSSVRKAKREPIAEFPQEDKKIILRKKQYFLDKYGIKNIPDLSNGDRKFLINYRFRQDEKTLRDISVVNGWVEANFNNSNIPLLKDELCRYYQSISEMYFDLNSRETEERFIVGSKGIPVDGKYMKIEMMGIPSVHYMKTSYKSASDYEDKINEFRSWIKTLKETPEDVLVRNKSYYDTIDEMNSAIKLCRNRLKNF